MKFYLKLTSFVFALILAGSASAMNNTEKCAMLAKCAMTCEMVVGGCGDTHAMDTSCGVKACADCSDLCTITAKMMCRGSELTNDCMTLCMKACQECAEMCNKNVDCPMHMACSKACMDCVKSCGDNCTVDCQDI